MFKLINYIITELVCKTKGVEKSYKLVNYSQVISKWEMVRKEGKKRKEMTPI